MSGCAGCGPLGTRFEQAAEMAKMVAQGHVFIAEHYDQISKDLEAKSPADAQKVRELAAFHRQMSESTSANIPVYEEAGPDGE